MIIHQTAHNGYNQTIYMIKLHEVSWKNSKEVIAAPIYFNIPTKQVYTPNEEVSSVMRTGEFLVREPIILETVIALCPDIESTIELYNAYLDIRHPEYSYH